MHKRFGDTTTLCNNISCAIKKSCIHFLALLEHKDREDATYLTPHKTIVMENDRNDSSEISMREECTDYLKINLPQEQYKTDCLFCSKESRCYKHHKYVCGMECKYCGDFYKKTID